MIGLINVSLLCGIPALNAFSYLNNHRFLWVNKTSCYLFKVPESVI